MGMLLTQTWMVFREEAYKDRATDIHVVETSEDETTVMVKDGVTTVIGGLIKNEAIKTEKRCLCWERFRSSDGPFKAGTTLNARQSW